MIDYLQLMTGSKRADSRQQEISDISRSLKAVARELSVPVLALSQLSRAVEQRPDHRPMLSDLRESGAIEQDADVVMFMKINIGMICRRRTRIRRRSSLPSRETVRSEPYSWHGCRSTPSSLTWKTTEKKIFKYPANTEYKTRKRTSKGNSPVPVLFFISHFHIMTI